MTIEELKALEKAATKGPWEQDGFTVSYPCGDGTASAVRMTKPEGALCVALINNCAALIAAAEALQKIIATADNNPFCSIGHLIEHGNTNAREALRALEEC